LFPVVTVLLARAVLKERLRPVQIAGVVVTMLGVTLISAG
jgi:EamA domain-containing membrane protein RarD